MSASGHREALWWFVKSREDTAVTIQAHYNISIVERKSYSMETEQMFDCRSLGSESRGNDDRPVCQVVTPDIFKSDIPHFSQHHLCRRQIDGMVMCGSSSDASPSRAYRGTIQLAITTSDSPFGSSKSSRYIPKSSQLSSLAESAFTPSFLLCTILRHSSSLGTIR